MGTEYRIAGVFQVPVAVVANGGDDLLGIVADIISRQGADQPSAPLGVGSDFGGIVPQTGYRRPSGENTHFAIGFRRRYGAGQPLQVGHGPAHIFCRHFQTELVPGLQ